MQNLNFDFIEQQIAEERRNLERTRKHYAAIDREGYIVNKKWLDPRVFSEIIGVDFGAGKMHFHRLYASDDGCVPLHLVPSTLESFGAATLVVVERAHLATPQTERSLSQPFTAEQLTDIYERCRNAGVTIKLFPHHHTRKCRDWSAIQRPGLIEFGKSSDINDARGLAYYVRWNNGIALGNPPASFCESRKTMYGKAVRKQSNVTLNAARARGYYGEVFPSVAIIAKAVSERFQEISSFVDYKVAFSIASLVVTEIDGEPARFSYEGRAPGADFFMKRVILFSSVHHGGGVARSNLFWHRFRPFLARFAQSLCESTKNGQRYVKFSHFTPSQDRIRRQALRSVRLEVRDAYRLAVGFSSEWPTHEVLQAEMEPTNAH